MAGRGVAEYPDRRDRSMDAKLRTGNLPLDAVTDDERATLGGNKSLIPGPDERYGKHNPD
jgi:hypothetical protein